jgi:hypothetical protein
MSNSTERRAPCRVALDYLERNEEKPINKYPPPGSTPLYIPGRVVRALFQDKPDGVTLESIFLCPCYDCEHDGGSLADRTEVYLSDSRKRELSGDYALIYALLIYIRRPGLIRKFQKHEISLQRTAYLHKDNFAVLKQESIAGLEVVQRKILEKQYCFLVRKLKPCSDVTAISPMELLPIQEDEEPRGEGSFAEVRCFKFQDNEYRSPEFGEVSFHMTRSNCV